MVKTLVRQHAKFDFELIGASEAVEFTIRCNADSNEVIVHLVNYTGGMSRPIKSVVPLHNLRLKVPSSTISALSLVENRELRMDSGGIKLPPLKEFEVIKLSGALN